MTSEKEEPPSREKASNNDLVALARSHRNGAARAVAFRLLVAITKGALIHDLKNCDKGNKCKT